MVGSGIETLPMVVATTMTATSAAESAAMA
jgi:hypothetical protein